VVKRTTEKAVTVLAVKAYRLKEEVQTTPFILNQEPG
jgi:hypothetical protein